MVTMSSICQYPPRYLGMEVGKEARVQNLHLSLDQPVLSNASSLRSTRATKGHAPHGELGCPANNADLSLDALLRAHPLGMWLG